MPELPEVEGARKLVQQHCQGKRIVRAVVAEDEKVINDVSPAELQAALVGRVLAAARRMGKQMWWELDSGPAVLVHLGMTGGIVVKGVGAAHYKSFHIDDSSWPPRWSKIELEFEDGTQIAFCDSRRFAKVRFLSDPETRPPISELRWDPILSWPEVDTFAAKLGGQRRAIKALLLDQSFSAGVGNWVADEVLYQSRIHPEQPANSIPADQAATLHRTIREVCELACSVDADSSRFPPNWLFHYRWGKGSSTKSKIEGHTIDHITVGGRTSAVVPALQKLSKAAIAAAAVKAAASGKKAGGKAGGKAAAGGKKKGGAAAAEGAESGSEGGEDVVAATVAEAGAAAAVAVAQGESKPRGRRSKAAVAQHAAAAAADVVEAVLVQSRGDDAAAAVPAARRKAVRGRPAKQQPQPEQPAAEQAQEEQEVPAAGRGARSFRGGLEARHAEDKPSGATAAGGTGKAQAAPAAARKRKMPASAAKGSAPAGEGSAVSGRRRKAAR